MNGKSLFPLSINIVGNLLENPLRSDTATSIINYFSGRLFPDTLWSIVVFFIVLQKFGRKAHNINKRISFKENAKFVGDPRLLSLHVLIAGQNNDQAKEPMKILQSVALVYFQLKPTNAMECLSFSNLFIWPLFLSHDERWCP